MGKEKSAKDGFSCAKTELIDFLYIDIDRIDSYISQIRQGRIRAVTTSDAVSRVSGGEGAADIKVMKGTVFIGNESNQGQVLQYDLGYRPIIELLSDLNLPVSSWAAELTSGRLSLLKASVRIRDIATVKSVMPAVIESGVVESSVPSKQRKELRSNLKMLQMFLTSIPECLGCTVQIKDAVLDGFLQPEYLTIKQADLSKNFGVALPGAWHVLGIVDDVEKDGVGGTIDSTNDKSDFSLEPVIDSITGAYKGLYDNHQYKITPILIFRQVL